MEELITIEIPEGISGRIDKVIADLHPDISRTRFKNLILEGFVVLDGTILTSASAQICGGEVVEITVPPIGEGDPQPENIPLDIICEDEHIIVLNKPAGLVVHPAPGNWSGTLVNALLYHCGDSLSGIGGVKRPGIVHRLDKETSGLMVVAKTDQAHQGLTSQFEKRTLSRKYQALVWGLPKSSAGMIETQIGRSKTNRKKMAVLKEAGKQAITHYRVLDVYGLTAALVECELETGRTHQIRVHMSHLGHPVIGDTIYGKRPRHVSLELEREVLKLLPTDRHMLHAYEIHFLHPISQQEMELVVDLPSDMDRVKEYLQQRVVTSR